jgi:hypothetical protein
LTPACYYPCNIEKDALFYFKIIILFIAKIGLNLPMDDHHFGYITKLTPQKKKKRGELRFGNIFSAYSLVVSEIGSLFLYTFLGLPCKSGDFSFVGF